MKVIVLSSGSKGNTTYIECGETKIIIGMGNSCKYVGNKLEGIGINAKDIDAIFITHTHVDHIKGLKVFLKIPPFFDLKILYQILKIRIYYLKRMLCPK